MDDFEILLDLFDFELVIAISDGAVMAILVMLAYGVIEEIIPVEILIVFINVFLEVDGMLLGY